MTSTHQPLVWIDNSKCKLCYACVRSCPVKAIRVTETDKFPEIIVKPCIGCGTCISSCNPQAIHYRDSIEGVDKMIKSGLKVIAIVSPSISAEFPDITDYRKFVQMIRECGFAYVHEVSFGVDVIAYKYQEFLKDFKGKYYITANDPVVVSYIEKYKPNLIHNLAPWVSPKVASAKIVRKKYGMEVKVVYIGPEIAAKDEALRYSDDGCIDEAITFIELRRLFDMYQITEGTVEFSDFDSPIGYKGSLYPIRNGFVQVADMDENLLDSKFISIEGKRAMITTLDEFESATEKIHKNMNITYGNSLLGPGNSKGNKLVKESLVIDYSRKRLKNFFRHEWYKQLNEYSSLDFHRAFHVDDQRLSTPSEEEVSSIIRQLGRSAEMNIGCEDCGYSSCHDFAVSVAQGITISEMCTTYSIQNSKKFINSLKITNQKLEATQNALKESEKEARKEKEAANYAMELANSMLQKLRAGIVIADQNLNILLSNKAFVKIMGEEAETINEVIPGLIGADLKKLVPENMVTLLKFVLKSGDEIENRDIKLSENLLNVSFFAIKKDQIVGAIIRDMNAPEVQKAEVINRVTEVIDKNLEMVQKIGFLLGESASSIEQELNSIIEFYKSANNNGG